jgi:hypothetical protein
LSIAVKVTWPANSTATVLTSQKSYLSPKQSFANESCRVTPHHPISTTYVPFKHYILPLELKIMSKSIFLGLTIGLLVVMAIPSVMTDINASYQNNDSDSSSNGTNDSGGAIEHINQAQTALQNGDTEGANNHLELAKQSLQSNQSDLGQ